MSKVQDVRKSSLTFAPEGRIPAYEKCHQQRSDREDIITGAGQAFEGGWTKVKLYFMLGLPTETEERHERDCQTI